jgi:hypothetical protein
MTFRTIFLTYCRDDPNVFLAQKDWRRDSLGFKATHATEKLEFLSVIPQKATSMIFYVSFGYVGCDGQTDGSI